MNNKFFEKISFNNSDLLKISETVSCKDSEIIPKVSDAGKVYFDDHHQKFFQIMHNGLKIFTDSHYGKFNVEIIRQLKGHHEPQEELVFYEILKKIPAKATMIELGSFWAYYSMWFNSQINEAKNYMVEPMFVEEGIKNFKINNLKGTKFIQGCVGSEYIDNLEFKQIDDRDNESLDGKGMIKETTVKIPQVSLDSLIMDNKIEYADIVHCDIQGHETEMLNGAKNSLLEKKIGYFFISTHSPLIHLQIIDKLKSYGYKIINEFSPRESYTSDGCVVACRPNLFEVKLKVTKKTSFSLLIKSKIDYLKYLFYKRKINK